ncbi:MAG: FtsQ-type POTRA domain-containing protein [Rhodospirillaceae bacterium]|jgi:cell division protein FtsQ|nr:FtsQ-type POTRA domain-containing protein [Rhodospirillaceae bacterium]MBT5895557.1 FtsQ-type POTRA domain-containing protein [Rhodospirillaceae bacterium]MBT6429476.1 FtsQ-type POTRA domain-containing protein [Rhodospirillaceae bacterium]MBT7757015.1 FtsQ-type POTRA domain-containing protein [Rhodospirillaceae bacterium]
MRALKVFQKPVDVPASKRRRTARPSVRRRRMIAFGLIAMVALGAGLGAWKVKESGVIGVALNRVHLAVSEFSQDQVVAAGLTVQHIFVTGRGETGKAEVLDAVGVESGQSILDFDPALARRRLLDLGWVKTARVERRLPDTIVVRLHERKALALWQHKGRHVLIDRGGKPITRHNLDRFAHLPVVVGQAAPLVAADLIDMLSRKPALFAQVQAAVRIGDRRWDVRLKNGIKVHLPEVDAYAAWIRLAELAAEQRIFDRDVAAIDLRLPDRLVLRLTPEAAAKKNKNGKDT